MSNPQQEGTHVQDTARDRPPPSYPSQAPPPEPSAGPPLSFAEMSARRKAEAAEREAAGWKPAWERAAEARAAKAEAARVEAAEAEAARVEAAEAARGTWPPEIPPPAEPRSFRLGGCPSEDMIAEDVLYELIDDYRYAPDLRCWIVRDGVRWVPSRDGVAPVVAAFAAATVTASALDNPATRKEGIRQGGTSGSWRGPGMPRESAWYTSEDIRTDELARKIKTTAAQARIAAQMRSLAAVESAETDRPVMAVRTDELDAEPHILWAGSVPFDLARSVTEPVWAEDAPRVPLTGMMADVAAYMRRMVAADGSVGHPDLMTEFGMSRDDAIRWMDRVPDSAIWVEGERWAMTWPHMLSCNYCPDIRVATPVWDELTAAIFPDVNEREHALNSFAHGLHGWPSEAAVLARAATGTGKSFLASLISDLLGDYAGQVAAKTLFGNSGNAQFAFDEMGAARFVVMNEGRKVNFEATEAFKAVVGPDPLVSARARHERHHRRMPARHTLMLTVNPNADLDYSDPAVVRRLIPAGFAGDPAKIRAIAARYGTKNAEGLAAWQAEAPGVLAQMIVRCAWVLGDPANRGTKADTPESAQTRFDAVTLEADPFGRWFNARTVEGSPTATDDLAEDYQRWCAARHEVPLSPAWFGRALASRGVERAKLDRNHRGWRIALRP